MTAANHIAYLRGCYLENRLARGKAEMGGKTLHLEKVDHADLPSRDA